MKLQRILPIAIVGALTVYGASCKKKDSTPVVTTSDTVVINDTVNTKDTVTVIPKGYSRILTGDVSSSRTLDNVADSPWILKGYVYVKDGATLTIAAGTVIKSDVVDKGALIFERGSKIMAEGTATNPIVMTSGAPKGQRRPGDWGGMIILGKAPTNRSTEPTIEGGVGKQYGGTDANDNSGVLKYVRIEYAGIAAEPGSEINGISFGGVGAGTTVENVMVSYGNDDAFEFFGGTVNCKNMIAFSCLDDDFDFDYGYTGTISNAISFKNPMFADPGDASNGIEADNDGSGTGATPNTHPKLNNFTMVGPNGASNTQANHNLGNRWRRNVEFTCDKFIIMGHQKGGFSVESSGTIDKTFDGTSKFTNALVHSAASGKEFISKDGVAPKASADLETLLTNGTNKCEKIADPADIGLEDPFNADAPNFMPKAGSKAATTGAGAMQGTDWTKGWASWKPNENDYK